MSLQNDIARPTATIDPNEIPIVDIGPVLAGTPDAVQNAATAFHAACTGMGFLFLINHGSTKMSSRARSTRRAGSTGCRWTRS